MFQMPINYMEAPLKVSLSHPFLQIQKKKKKLHKRRGQKKGAYITGQKNDDSVQTTKTRQKRQRRSQSPKKYDYIGHITSSSDDDIPLANIKFRKRVILEQQDDSDKDETFKPSARE